VASARPPCDNPLSLSSQSTARPGFGVGARVTGTSSRPTEHDEISQSCELVAAGGSTASLRREGMSGHQTRHVETFLGEGSFARIEKMGRQAGRGCPSGPPGDLNRVHTRHRQAQVVAALLVEIGLTGGYLIIGAPCAVELCMGSALEATTNLPASDDT